jgi:putative Holliday junction resolvase
MRALGVDVGERRIGLAVSDPSGVIASPLGVIDRADDDDPVAQILRCAQELKAEVIVVGMPVDLRGEEGVAAQRMGEFVAQLRERSPVRVETCDERLTSAAAARAMREAGLSERERRGQVDKVAAALILQTWLDRARAHRDQR